MKATLTFTLLSNLLTYTSCSLNSAPVVNTTSGSLRGAERDGVISFKGIPFGQPPKGALRWEPPKLFLSQATRDATAFSPSCIQQIPLGFQILSNTTTIPTGESEDCLFLNVWTPAQTQGQQKPVVVWYHGGAFALGTASVPEFDGTSFAKNQDIVIVTTNYRTNAFGFPGGEELFPGKKNLGFMDQDLALQWVQDNIAAFGGDPKKITIMGQSAGAISIAQLLQRHAHNAPFRAAIMQSGTATSMSPIPNFTSFDAMAKAVNCSQPPGAERLACLKAVPEDAIRAWANGPQGLAFEPMVDNVTMFADPFHRIKEKKTARVPILNGANQDDGTLFTVGQASLPDFLNRMFGSAISADQVRVAYPALNDTQIIPTVFRDFVFLCPAQLTTSAYVESGWPHVFRYMYGPVFADLQIFPGAGAWHTSEIPEIFGTFNAATATTAEKTLSHTMQTVWSNFIKDPTTPPAPNWQQFVPGTNTNTLAKLAYHGNVDIGNVVQLAPAGLDDGPCNMIWNALLDF